LKYQEDEIKAYRQEHGMYLIHNFRDEGICGARLNEEALEFDGWAYRKCWLTFCLSKLILWWSSTQADYGGQIL